MNNIQPNIVINEPKNYSTDLLSSITKLQSLFFEDYQKALNKNSSDSLLRFMTYYTRLKLPLMGAEESGTIIATWKKNDECFSIRFIDEQTIDFSIIYKQEDMLKQDWGKENPYKIFDKYCPGYIFKELSILQKDLSINPLLSAL